MTASHPLRALLAVIGLSLVCVPGAAAAEPSWRLEQPPPPEGAAYKVPVGSPGDLQFIAPNRGLLATSGNAVVPAGLLYWNGARWSQLSTVCGGSAATMRIAVAGPEEFWTVSSPSRPRVGDGIALCHFKRGEVVGSYSKQPQDADPYWRMNAAACMSPDDCWFAGSYALDPSGARSGAFRIHWDGTKLTTVYGPSGRGVSDLLAVKGTTCPVTITDEWPGAAGWGVVVAALGKASADESAVAAAKQDALRAGATEVAVVDTDRHGIKPGARWLVVARYGSKAAATAALPALAAVRPSALLFRVPAFDPKSAAPKPEYLSRFYETAVAGAAPESPAAAPNPTPEPNAVLIHFINRRLDAFSPDPFLPPTDFSRPDGSLDLLALDGDGSTTWAAGSGAASGPRAPAGGMFSRKPVLAVSTTGPDCGFGDFREVPLDTSQLRSDERIVDVAAVPGTQKAWVAIQPFADRVSRNASASVARVDSVTGAVERMEVPGDGRGYGAAAKVDCNSASDCWLVTTAGWVFHWTDGAKLDPDTSAAFSNVITYRPNESAAQFVPDTPPIDDSDLFKPAPTKPLPKPKPGKPIKLKPLMAKVSSKVNGMTLTISFTLRRPAKVGLLARRGRSTVASAKPRMMKPGRRSLSLRLSRDRWPTGLAFLATEPGLKKTKKKKPSGGLIGN
jgi:hypothetical protein